MQFLETGLRHDWSKIEMVRHSRVQVQEELHKWECEWKARMADRAEEVVEDHMKLRMRMQHVPTASRMATVIMESLNAIQDKHGLKRGEVYIVNIFDLSAPWGRAKSKIKTFASSASTISDECGERSVSIIYLPDLPSPGSVKGIDEDEDTMKTEFNGQGLDIDTRFLLVHSGGDYETLRGWSQGRLAFKPDKKETNVFKTTSKLALRGRPTEIVSLPKTSDMHRIEGLSANDDLDTRDRQTFSKEKIAAQKGPEETCSEQAACVQKHCACMACVQIEHL